MFKVRDHCHFTGKYRGAAHNSCNLQCRKPMIVPEIFHNLQGYDSHLFIKQLAKVKGGFICIPSTEEKYLSFSKKQFHPILKFDLSTLLSFLKHLWLIVSQIFNQQILKIPNRLLKIMSHFSLKKVFIRTIMFLLSINSLKHNFLQNQNFIQS